MTRPLASAPRLPLAPALCSLLLALCALPTSTLAQSTSRDGFEDGWTPEEHRAYSPHFQGMFSEIGFRYGLLRLPEHALTEADTFGTHARFAFPMSVGDLRLAYNFTRLPSSRRAHTLGIHLAIHPLYLLMLGSDWLSYVLGALYVDAGLGPHYLSNANSSSLWSTMLSLGAGIDIPLFSTHHGQAPWLNLSYQRQSSRLARDTERTRSHQLHIGLAWRWNRLPF